MECKNLNGYFVCANHVINLMPIISVVSMYCAQLETYQTEPSPPAENRFQ